MKADDKTESEVKAVLQTMGYTKRDLKQFNLSDVPAVIELPRTEGKAT